MTGGQMANHWWWRPGWRPGRRMYTWHFTFDGRPEVGELADAYQMRLAGLPGLDLIPARWLHLTTQGVGFTDEVDDDQVGAIVSASMERLKGFPAQQVKLGPARVTPEALLLDVTPADGLAAIRRELREIIANVLGPGRLLEGEEWEPHVSVAYSNATGPQEPYTAALKGGGTTRTIVSMVELIILGRDQHLYEWTTRAPVPLASNTADVPGGALR